LKHGYIGEFEIIDGHRAGKIIVNLTGRLNKCGIISLRFDVKEERPREMAEQPAPITAV
jgi:small subunit ribosomal protein S15Ae